MQILLNKGNCFFDCNHWFCGEREMRRDLNLGSSLTLCHLSTLFRNIVVRSTSEIKFPKGEFILEAQQTVTILDESQSGT